MKQLDRLLFKLTLFTQYFLERFLEVLNIPEYQTKGLSSGFIFHEDGYILTNYLVIEKAKEITVTSYQMDKKYEAELIGGDSDLRFSYNKTQN